MIFLIILIIPFIIIGIGFMLPGKKIGTGRFGGITRKITFKEFLILLATSIIIAGISAAIIYYQNVTYTEVYNGLVIKKEREQVSCRHSYDCNCHTSCSGSGKDRSCTEYCDTCYEHSHDYDYNVYNSIGEVFNIKTIDRQGINIPPRFSSIKIGEPTSSKHSYENYIKATSGNLFRKQGMENNKYQIPQYPQNIYDYYKYDRIINTGINIPNIQKYQYQLSEINGRLGPLKQCNIIFVFVKNQNPKYFYALEQAWEGGNKNDIITIINVDNENKIQWVNILALVDNDLFRIKLRDEILSIQTLDMEKILPITEKITKEFYKRKRMRNFDYLKYSIIPTESQLIISIIINSLICLGLTILFYREDVV